MRAFRRHYFIIGTLFFLTSLASGATTIERSKTDSFQIVSEFLQPGGVLYSYINIGGDLEKFTRDLNRLLAIVRRHYPNTEIPDVDLTKIIRRLGLHRLEAIGVSSKSREEGFQNRLFVYVPEGREGLFALTGGRSHPFEVLDIAPREADIVYEQDLNISSLYDMISDLAAMVYGEEGSAYLDAVLRQPIANLPVTGLKLIRRFNTRLYLTVVIHEYDTITIPGESIPIPRFEFLIGLENMGWILDRLSDLVESMPFLISEKKGGFDYLKAELGIEGDWAFFRPVLAR